MKYIYEMESDQSENFLWTNSKKPFSENQFFEEFYKKENSYYNCYFLIFTSDSEYPIGFIYSYGADFIDGICFATIYLISEYRKKGCGAIAGAIFIDYLFSRYNYRKIYFDVFSYNKPSLQFLKTSGCIIEGNFKNHKYFNGNYFDMFRLAMYRDDFYLKNQKLISMVTLNKQIKS